MNHFAWVWSVTCRKHTARMNCNFQSGQNTLKTRIRYLTFAQNLQAGGVDIDITESRLLVADISLSELVYDERIYFTFTPLNFNYFFLLQTEYKVKHI